MRCMPEGVLTRADAGKQLPPDEEVAGGGGDAAVAVPPH